MSGDLHHLREALARSRAENDRLRRILVHNQLVDLDIDVVTPAALKAIDDYPIMVDGETDMSLLRLRTWLVEEMGMEV